MRLKAREDLMYAGKEVAAGFIFDATEADGQRLINQDLAVPFRLEDPSTLPDEEPVGAPDEKDLPDEEEEDPPPPAPKSPHPHGGETVFSEPQEQKPWTSKKPPLRK